MTFGFYLWPNGVVAASDFFAAPEWSLRLSGSYLEVMMDDPAATEERAREVVAEPYVAAFNESYSRPVTILTEREFIARSALGGRGPVLHTVAVVSADHRAEWSGLSRAVRAARNTLLGPKSEALRRCYGYIQDSREDEEHVLFHLYKAWEVLSEALGGEKQATSKLGVSRKAIKRFTGLTSASSHDERHPPKRGEAVSPVTDDERQGARDFLAGLVHRFAKL